MKKLTLLVFVLVYNFSVAQDWIQIGQTISGLADGERLGYSTDISADGNSIIVGSPFAETLYGKGYAAVFEKLNNEWSLKGQLINAYTDNDLLGFSVCMSEDGNTIAVSAPFYSLESDLDLGIVRILIWDGESWIPKGQDMEGSSAFIQFGTSISLSSDGNIIAVGIPYSDAGYNNGGEIIIYKWGNNNWEQLGNSIIGTHSGELIGSTIQLNNEADRIVVGAPSNNIMGNNFGSVRVYELQNNHWIQLGNSLFGSFADEQFGNDVSINADGSIIAIGSSSSDTFSANAGLTRVFGLEGDSWIQKGNSLGGGNLASMFKTAVALSADGNTVAIGASGYSQILNYAGQIRVYEWTEDSWSAKGSFVNGIQNDWLGNSIKLSSDGNKYVSGSLVGLYNQGFDGNVKVFEYANSLSISNSSTANVSLNIFPSPANSTLHLQSESLFQYIKLIDLAGRIVLYQSFSPTKQTSFDVRTLHTGIYLLQVETEHGLITKKVVVE